MLKKNLSDTEPEQQDRFYECLECDEAIFNPICPDCLLREIDSWIIKYPKLKRKIVPKLKKYIQSLKKLSKSSTQCIACNKKRASLCTFCFTDFVFKKLKQLHASKTAQKEFLVFFNFDFEHVGYSKDAEKLGVI